MAKHSFAARWLLVPLALWGINSKVAEASESGAVTPSVFHPSAYPKSVAVCKGLNRRMGIEKDLDIHYVNVNPNAKETIVMVHGWPGLWSNWGDQILEFQDEYHLIAMDQRGFGSSTHPGDVQSSGTMGDLVGDIVCVLRDAGVANAICMGHDWGAQVCWEAARMRPDVFTAVIAAAVPYLAAGDKFAPATSLASMLPTLGYQVYFQDQTQEAIRELSKNIRRTIRAVYRGVNNRIPSPEGFLRSTADFLGVYGDGEIQPSGLLTEEEEDYLVEQYSIQKFENTLQFYTYENRHAAWEFDRDQGNLTIPQPALNILPTKDLVADWVEVAKLMKSAELVPRLNVAAISTAHWPQIEQPEEFNAIVKKWLDDLKREQVTVDDETKQKHFSDEL